MWCGEVGVGVEWGETGEVGGGTSGLYAACRPAASGSDAGCAADVWLHIGRKAVGSLLERARVLFPRGTIAGASTAGSSALGWLCGAAARPKVRAWNSPSVWRRNGMVAVL